MKVTLAQTKYKTGDFKFNYDSIVEKIVNINSDLIVMPQVGLEDIGGKDLLLDENANNAQSEMYSKIAENFADKTILIGDVLICKGEISLSVDGFYDICGKRVFVADFYNSEVE